MELKKNKKVDLNPFMVRVGFLSVGGVLATAMVLCYMEYQAFKSNNTLQSSADTDFVEGEQEVTLLEEPEEEIEEEEPPPPPPPMADEVEETPEDEEETADFAAQNEVKVEDRVEEEEEEEEEEIEVEEIFDFVEVDPEFPGGTEELYKYLGDNMKYPPQAMDAGIQGKVYIQFVVGSDGKIKDVKVVKGVHGSLDKEAMRVVKGMPKWTPGKQMGKSVSARYNIPINFQIN